MDVLDFNTHIIADARQIKCDPDWTRNITNRPYHGFIYVKNGQFLFSDATGNFTLTRDNILFLEKGATYKIVSTECSEIIVISFDAPQPSLLLDTIVMKLEPNNQIVTLFDDLAKEFMNISSTCKLKCKSIFYDLAAHIYSKNRLQQETTTADHLRSTVAYIHAHFSERILMSDVAKRIFLSPTHFRRVFKNHYGISPSEYLNTVRINKAKELINLNAYSLSEIACMTGFCDLYHFSRTFKKTTGITPSAYKSFS